MLKNRLYRGIFSKRKKFLQRLPSKSPILIDLMDCIVFCSIFIPPNPERPKPQSSITSQDFVIHTISNQLGKNYIQNLFPFFVLL